MLTLTRWSVSYTSCADFDSVDFLLHIPYCFHFYLGSVPYTSRAGFFSFLFFFPLGSFSYTSRADFFIGGVSLTHPVLISLLEEFLLHIPCWLFFFFFFFFLLLFLGSFSYTTHISFNFIWGVSLTHPVLAFILSAGFRLHMPCWLHFYLGSFSYTSRANFVFIWRFSLIHPVLASFYAMSFSYTSRADFFFFFIL